MKHISTLLLFLSSFTVHAQEEQVSKYLESIRDNDAALTSFFSQMPKGGDLHNHYSGSVYAESYINWVVSKNYCINSTTYEVSDTLKPGATWLRFATMDANTLNYCKQQLIQKWSVKDYNGISQPSDQQFFNTFGGFGMANYSLDSGLLELKNRAVGENVQYIETMFTGIPCYPDTTGLLKYNTLLRNAQKTHDETTALQLLGQMDEILSSRGIANCASKFNAGVADRHQRLHLDDGNFTLRYQNYVTRVIPPVNIFTGLLTSFLSANTSPLIVGVNIVAPENNDVSMADYWLHMVMFKYCHSKYPNVKYSMHAGELCLGMVKPEELTWHIYDAINIAGANRIGHGVDMPYEHNNYSLLKKMADEKRAIEINLYSNEFILKVKESMHPINLYKQFGVPIVISTDDAGVLRSNLIHQYVLLAKRYKNISYADMKEYVHNSITYSFIEEKTVKAALHKEIDAGFRKFEQDVLRWAH